MKPLHRAALHTDAFSQKKFLHTGTLTRRCPSFYTQELLHTHTHALQKEAFRHRNFYSLFTRKLLHRSHFGSRPISTFAPRPSHENMASSITESAMETLKAKLTARQEASLRCLRMSDPAAKPESLAAADWGYSKVDLLTELAACGAGTAITSAVGLMSDETALEWQNSTLQDRKVKPNQEELKEARRGLNSFIALPTGTKVTVVKRFESVSDKSLSTDDMCKRVAKLKAEKGGQILISINPYFVGSAIGESLAYISDLISKGCESRVSSKLMRGLRASQPRKP